VTAIAGILDHYTLDDLAAGHQRIIVDLIVLAYHVCSGHHQRRLRVRLFFDYGSGRAVLYTNRILNPASVLAEL
jgi:hypothetical protein